MNAAQALGPLSDQLSMEQALVLMSDVKEVRKQCIRNGFIMPPADDAICTPTFVRGVAYRQYWCLTVEMQNMHPQRQMADPPSRKYLAQILHDKMQAPNNNDADWNASVRNTAEAILRHPPQLWWMERVLAFVDNSNELFDPMYSAPVP